MLSSLYPMNYLLLRTIDKPMRLKHVLSHNRNIDMIMTTKTIKYSIPLYSEKDYMGEFLSAKVKDGELCVTYKSKNVEEIKYPPIVKAEPNFIVDFSK
jgi:hypothetical protein